MVYTFGPPYSIWRNCNHVIFDWCNNKYYIYYNCLHHEKEKEINLFQYNYESKRKHRQQTVLS